MIGGLCALLWYGALSVLVTWPIALHPVDTILGHPEASAACHVWVLWWAQHHLSDLHTDLIFYPYGGDVVTLYGSDALSPLLLRWFPLPPSLLYNLWVMLLFVLGGLGMDRLVRNRGASAGGALVAGTVFMTAPFFQHEALNGTSEIVAAGLLPWFLLAFFHLLDRPEDRTLAWGLALGTSCGLAVAASAYNLFFCLLLAGVLTLSALATRDGPVFRRPLIQGIVAAGVAVLPFGAALAWLQVAHGAGAVYSRRADWTSADLALPDAFADLDMWLDHSAAVIPAVRLLPDGEQFLYWTTSTVFLGWVAVALALIGLWRGRRDHRLGRFGVLVIVGVLVASGPYLRLGGSVLYVFGHRLGMPGLLMARVFPPFVITAVHSYRYTVIVLIGLAVLAGFSVRRARVGLLLSLLVVGEAVFASPLPWPAPTTPMVRSVALDALAEAPPGGVLHLPIEADKLGDLGELLLAQIVHGKPVQDGGIHRRAGEDATRLFSDVPMVADLARRGDGDDRQLRLPGPKTTAWSLGQLYGDGFRYVLSPRRADTAELRAWLGDALGAPTASDEDWVWWTLLDPVGSGLPR